VTLAWFQCEAGAAGDMLLAALVDAGAPIDDVRAAVDAVDVEPVRITVEHVERGGLPAVRALVHVPESTVVRTWANIRALLEGADALPDAVRGRALDVFERLANAEATVHRTTPEQVHFHEVGALDAIADVVGVCAALHALDVDDAAATAVALGQGMTRSAHGLVPVPAPAVLELLLDTAVADDGAGDGATVLETNVDDLDPRLWPAVLVRLLEAGAADAWLTPIVMKKGRPAHTLSVLVPAGGVDAVRAVVFAETSAIGVREHPVRKHALQRSWAVVRVDGHDVRVKLATVGERVVNAQPEYDDVAAVAAATGRPAKAVLAAAVAAAHDAGVLP